MSLNPSLVATRLVAAVALCLPSAAGCAARAPAPYKSGPPFGYAVTIVQEGQRSFDRSALPTATLFGVGGEVLGRADYEAGVARVLYGGGGHPRFLLVGAPGYYIAGFRIDSEPVMTPVPLWVELRAHPALIPRTDPGQDVTVKVSSNTAGCAGENISVFWWSDDGRELDRAATDASGIARLRKVAAVERPRFLLVEPRLACQVTGLPFVEGVTDYEVQVEGVDIR